MDVLLALGLLLQHIRLLEGKERLVADLLANRRDVAVVEDLDAVDLVVHVGGGEPVGDRPRVGERGPVCEAGPGGGELQAPELERRLTAATRRVPDGLQALPPQLRRSAVAGADDLGVEGAREAAVARHEQ